MKRFQSNLLKAKTDSLKGDNIKEDEDSGWLTHRLVFALDKSKVKWCENKGLLLVGCFEFSQVAPSPQGEYIQIFSAHAFTLKLGGESF